MRAAIATRVAAVVLLKEQPRDDRRHRRVRHRVQLLRGQELHRMRHQDHAVGRHAEQPRLLQRLVDERLGADRSGRHPEPLEPYDVVHTARHARASVGEALDGEVAVDRDLLDHLARRRLREDLLREPERLGAGGAQVLLDAVEELAAAVLA